MRDISKYRNKILKAILKEKNKDGKTFYTLDEELFFSMIAEREAIRYQIIPKGYQKYNISDLTGLSDSMKALLSEEIAAKAKETICSFLWPDLTLEKIKDISEFDNFTEKLCNASNIEFHRRKGTNVVIYGHQNSGKTLCASIIMNHIIDMHIKNSKNYSQVYDWISFGILRHSLINKNEFELSYLKNIDWLVIDDITDLKGSSKQIQKYDSYLLDSFFLSRLEDGLPTILVFNFSLDGMNYAFEHYYGVAMNKIISDKDTIKIGLSI